MRPTKSIYSADQRALAAVLRQARTEAGLRQVDVAAALGRPQSFVAKYETGERRLDIIELRQVGQALGVSLRTIVRRFEAESEE